MKIRFTLPLVLPVAITGPQGTREINAALDTGASFTSIPWDVARDIGYDPATVTDRVELITGSGIILTPLLTAQDVSLGGLHASDCRVICHDLPEIGGLEGVLGESFLKRFKVTIDYKEQMLEITDP